MKRSCKNHQIDKRLFSFLLVKHCCSNTNELKQWIWTWLVESLLWHTVFIMFTNPKKDFVIKEFGNRGPKSVKYRSDRTLLMQNSKKSCCPTFKWVQWMLDSLVILIDLGSNNTINNDLDMNKSSIHSMSVAFLLLNSFSHYS